MAIGRIRSRRAIAAASGGTGPTLLAAMAFCVLSAPLAAQTTGTEVSCTGEVPNGWAYAAHALEDRFLHIVWTGPTGQVRVSPLVFLSTNAEGFPVFGGTLQDTIPVTLVDLSGGAPGTGTEVVVHSEAHGWFPGSCRGIGSETPEGLLSVAVIRQNLLGVRDTTATNWLRRNEFTLVGTVSHSGEGKSERWQQDPSYPVEVIYSGNIVSDVVAVAP
ncbi:MAG: hypothetical protein JJT81_16625 [Rubellimicrobium sp.]|nr:hypothetical protein [Rubellimicrobium sp.]